MNNLDSGYLHNALLEQGNYENLSQATGSEITDLLG